MGIVRFIIGMKVSVKKNLSRDLKGNLKVVKLGEICME